MILMLRGRGTRRAPEQSVGPDKEVIQCKYLEPDNWSILLSTWLCSWFGESSGHSKLDGQADVLLLSKKCQ